MRILAILALVAVVFAGSASAVYDIRQFGAIAGNASSSYNVSYINGKALYNALQAANGAAGGPAARTVLVPGGLEFALLPYAPFVGLEGVTLVIDGTLSAFSGDNLLWPNDTWTGRTLHIMEFDNCNNITVTGTGMVDGNGWRWWWYVFLTGLDNRPHMIVTRSVTNMLLEGLTLINSPQYHVFLNDMINVTVQGLTVYVNVEGQKEILRHFGLLSTSGLPIFPLNTDGIDISAVNGIVRNCTVENFDDSVCIKPSNRAQNLTSCASNIHVYDVNITNGVGASVGSVPPNLFVNCIDGILFENIRFDHPIKTIYVKPNPCPNPEVDGTGTINHITYQNIFADTPLWWTIWVSTQQQEQPGAGADTHCSFFYPIFNSTCPTQGCVPVTNLTIRNVSAINALLSPGVLRCNETGPCKDWVFENVVIDTATGFPFGANYLCHALENFTIINSAPAQCVWNYTDSPETQRMLRDRPDLFPW